MNTTGSNGDFFRAPGRYPAGIPGHVCDLYEKLTFQVWAAGHQHYSSRAILHQIRWHYQIEQGDIHFKVNNNYSARLARWLMKKHPQMAGFFETRNKSPHNMFGYREPDDLR